MKILKKEKLFGLVMISILVLQACSGDDSGTALISGAKRRSQKEKELLLNVASTVYTVPQMDLVQVKVNDRYAQDKFMDIYYPPGFSFDSKLPAVVIYNGFAGLKAKNTGRHIDWGALVAAHGMIAVTYDPTYPDKDLELLITDLVNRTDELCIQADNLGMVGYCGCCPDVLRAFIGEDCPFSDCLNTGVFLYGTMPWNDELRKDTSMLVVKPGKGLEDNIKSSISSFMEKAEDEGMDVKLIDYEEGFKYFDVTETPNKPWEYGVNQEFTADCDVMK